MILNQMRLNQLTCKQEFVSGTPELLPVSQCRFALCYNQFRFMGRQLQASRVLGNQIPRSRQWLIDIIQHFLQSISFLEAYPADLKSSAPIPICMWGFMCLEFGCISNPTWRSLVFCSSPSNSLQIKLSASYQIPSGADLRWSKSYPPSSS